MLVETRFADGRKHETREWIPNPILNQHISGRAAVIGSDIDLGKFDYSRLRRHRGGLLGSRRLQTYAAGETWHRITPDFFVTRDADQIQELLAADMHQQSILYTTARGCIDNPGSFYLIPFSPLLEARAAAVYLAAFDGHREVFLLGFNNDMTSDERHWRQHVQSVFQAYDTTKFWLVGVQANMPTAWRSCANVDCMDYPRFITYCDI